MAKILDEPEKREWSWLQKALGAAGAFGLFLLFVSRSYHLGEIIGPHIGIRVFMRDVSFALLISCVFGLTIEFVQRAEFVRLVTKEREHLKDDVFLYALGHNIPEEVRQEIRSRILHQPFHRRDLEINWTFAELSSEPGMISLKKEFSWTVVNTGAEDADFEFKYTQISATLGRQTKFGVLRVKYDNGWTDIERSAAEMEEEKGTQPHEKKLRTEFKVPARSTARAYYSVDEERGSADEDNYSARHAVVGTTKVQVDILPPLSLEITVSCKTNRLTPAINSKPPERYSYTFNEGLLPYQGIIIGWSRREERPAGGTTKAG